MWKKEEKYIKKHKTPEPSQGYKYYNKLKKNGRIGSLVNGYANQGTLFEGEVIQIPGVDDVLISKEDRYDEYLDFNSYNACKGEMTREQFDQWDDLQRDVEKRVITQEEYLTRLTKIGVDEYGQPLPKE